MLFSLLDQDWDARNIRSTDSVLRDSFMESVCRNSRVHRLNVATSIIHISLAQEIRFHQGMSLPSLNTCSRDSQIWRGKEASARI